MLSCFQIDSSVAPLHPSSKSYARKSAAATCDPKLVGTDIMSVWERKRGRYCLKGISRNTHTHTLDFLSYYTKQMDSFAGHMLPRAFYNGGITLGRGAVGKECSWNTYLHKWLIKNNVFFSFFYTSCLICHVGIFFYCVSELTVFALAEIQYDVIK